MKKISTVTIKPEIRDAGLGSLGSYLTGFVFSIILTLIAYYVVTAKLYSSNLQVVSIIISLAILQLFVQLIFFLHLGRESKPRWNVTVFVFAATVVLIVVFGSIWIMNNLNYNMAHSSDSYIRKDELIKQ